MELFPKYYIAGINTPAIRVRQLWAPAGRCINHYEQGKLLQLQFIWYPRCSVSGRYQRLFR